MKILKIGADWCPECVIMKFRWQEVEKEMPKLDTKSIDIDKNKEIKKERNIEDIPAFIFLDDSGAEIPRLTGLIEVRDLIDNIKKINT